MSYDEITPELLELAESMTALEYGTEVPIPLGYLLDKEQKTIRVPTGMGDKFLRSKLNYTGAIKIGSSINVQKTDFKMKNTPIGIQDTVIKTIAQTLKKNTQIIIDLPTGIGKTFVAIDLSSKLGFKTLILTGTDKLRQQWYDSFLTHTDMRRDRISIMSGASDFGTPINPNIDVYICTHHSLRAVFNGDRTSMIRMNEWLLARGIGLKIYDEADLETKSMFRLDLCTSVLRTLYLTATTEKSSTEENRVYQRAFKEIPRFGAEHFVGIVPSRHALVLRFDSKPGRCLYPRSLRFNGDFCWFKNLEYMFMYRPEIVQDVVKQALDVWQWVIKNKDKEAKILINISRKDYCFILRDLIHEWFGIDRKLIGVYNSMSDPKWKEYELKKPIIISTIKSMGRGVDIKGLKVHLDCEYYTSVPMFKQAVGRTARNGGDGWYIHIIDTAWSFVNFSYKRKAGMYSELFKSVKTKELDYSNTIEIIEDKGIAKDKRNQFIKKWWKYLRITEEAKKKKLKNGGNK